VEVVLYARVALPIPVDHGFDFVVPDALAESLRPGHRVAVRVGGQPEQGIVVARRERSEHAGPFETIEHIIDGPSYSAYGLAFAQRVAERYLTPYGLVLHRALPRRCGRAAPRWLALAAEVAAVLDAIARLESRAPRQAEALRRMLAARDALPETVFREALGSRYRAVITRLIEQGWLRIVAAPEAGSAARGDRAREPEAGTTALTTLVHGADRLDRYAARIRAAVAEDRLALLVAPSILHAEQLHDSLREAAPGRSAVYHSGLPEGRRGDVWEAVRSGQVQLLVGTRSALFVPGRPPSCILVDDEAAPGHRQDEMAPRYHVRDLARLHDGAELLLGASAPSLESWHAAKTGTIRDERLAEEPERRRVRIIDMRRHARDPLSPPLIESLRAVLDAEGRALVCVPRRGYAQAIVCKACGQPLRCPRCHASLSYRARSAQFLCLRCGQASSIARCAACGSRALRFVGHGSEQVADALRVALPEVRTVLLDASAMRGRRAIDEALLELNGLAELLVATPVVATGPPIEGLRLVAALDVDALLARPDFRASEHAYQYLDGLLHRMTQGQLIIQTAGPEHPVILAIARGDPEPFYRRELEEREALGYPPCGTVLHVTVPARRRSGRREERLLDLLSRRDVEVLGPVEQRGSAELLVKMAQPTQARPLAIEMQSVADGIEIAIDGPMD
jgi:primosomal protein N' (replication factor Y)